MLIEMSNLSNKDILGMSNFDLEQLGKKCLLNFKGVYPSDSFPIIKKKDELFFSVIFNLSPHNEDGSHFIAVVKKQNNFYYFDSFGDPCNVISLKNNLSNITSKIIYSAKQIQDSKSIYCSLFCLAFILHVQKNVSNNIISFLKLFDNELKMNDRIVKNIVIKEILNIVCPITKK